MVSGVNSNLAQNKSMPSKWSVLNSASRLLNMTTNELCTGEQGITQTGKAKLDSYFLNNRSAISKDILSLIQYNNNGSYSSNSKPYNPPSSTSSNNNNNSSIPPSTSKPVQEDKVNSAPKKITPPEPKPAITTITTEELLAINNGTNPAAKDRGIQPDSKAFHKSLGVLRYTACPAILSELAFISNDTDRTFFKKRMNLFASNMAEGIATYAELNNKKTNKKLFVILDPGHGGEKAPGAIGGGEKESELVLKYCQTLQAKLKKLHIDSVLTRTDNDTGSNLSKDHIKIANDIIRNDQKNNPNNQQILISIHLNAGQKTASGMESFYASTKGKALANIIHPILAQTGMPIPPITLIAQN